MKKNAKQSIVYAQKELQQLKINSRHIRQTQVQLAQAQLAQAQLAQRQVEQSSKKDQLIGEKERSIGQREPFIVQRELKDKLLIQKIQFKQKSILHLKEIYYHLKEQAKNCKKQVIRYLSQAIDWEKQNAQEQIAAKAQNNQVDSSINQSQYRQNLKKNQDNRKQNQNNDNRKQNQKKQQLELSLSQKSKKVPQLKNRIKLLKQKKSSASMAEQYLRQVKVIQKIIFYQENQIIEERTQGIELQEKYKNMAQIATQTISMGDSLLTTGTAIIQDVKSFEINDTKMMQQAIIVKIMGQAKIRSAQQRKQPVEKLNWFNNRRMKNCQKLLRTNLNTNDRLDNAKLSSKPLSVKLNNLRIQINEQK